MGVRLGADATSTDVYELKALGATFCSRYLSDFPSKNLTLAEAERLSAANIDVVSNWENDTTDWQGGYSAGVRNARVAWAQHKQCGGPDGRPIYFSVDMDVNPGNGTLHAYFKGLGDGMTPGQIGVYASTGVCNALKSAGLAHWTWRTMSTGWNGGVGDPSMFNVEQTGYLSQRYDRNASITDDFGQWRIGAAPVPTPAPAPVPAPGGDLPTPRDVWAYKANDAHRPDGDNPDVHQSLLDCRDAAQACFNLMQQMKTELDAIKAKLGA